MDTIYAMASARGRSGVAVLRISGSGAFGCAKEICGALPEARKAVLRILRDENGAPLDEALVLTFPGPGSFTGEDIVEFQLHGSQAVIAAVMRRVGSFDGLRLAEPGEFTRRAFENGRLDLSQVEGLGDLIEAETEAQRRQALRVFSGDFGKKAAHWREKIVRAGALLAVSIDFADEEIPDSVSVELSALIETVLNELRQEFQGSFIAERIRSGFEVAIVGPPNIGKSTLLNAIAGREAAIISEIEGTTRDIIEVQMDLRGLAVTLLDTAGLRQSLDLVENLGMERARERAELADIRVFLSDDGVVPEGFELRDGDEVLVGKDDSGEKGGVSGMTGFGVSEMITRIAEELEKRTARAGLAMRERHREALGFGISELEQALDKLQHGDVFLDLVSDSVTRATRSMDMLIGKVGVEDLFDEIFASFCLGK
jgi:tRNA modification GTPase